MLLIGHEIVLKMDVSPTSHRCKTRWGWLKPGSCAGIPRVPFVPVSLTIVIRATIYPIVIATPLVSQLMHDKLIHQFRFSIFNNFLPSNAGIIDFTRIWGYS
jgi:hypothetical protein